MSYMTVGHLALIIHGKNLGPLDVAFPVFVAAALVFFLARVIRGWADRPWSIKTKNALLGAGAFSILLLIIVFGIVS